MYIELTQGKWTCIDNSDFQLIREYNWFASKSAYNWYARSSLLMNGKKVVVYMHRLIVNCPDDKVVHHKNGDSLDNRRSNLEIVDRETNSSYRGKR